MRRLRYCSWSRAKLHCAGHTQLFEILIRNLFYLTIIEILLDQLFQINFPFHHHEYQPLLEANLMSSVEIGHQAAI